MRLIIGVSALAVCVLLGINKSASLTENVAMTESLISFFTEYRNKVEYTEDTIFEIVKAYRADKNESFVFMLREYLREYDFPEAWKKAVSEIPAYFSDYDKDLLYKFGAKIGTSDKESQIKLSDYLIGILKSSLEEKKENEKKCKKLYSFCGVAVGLIAFIMII